MAKKILRKKRSKKMVTSSDDVPATRGELKAITKQLSHLTIYLKKHTESTEKRFGSIDARFESMEKRFDSIDQRFDSMEKKIDSKFNMLMSEISKVIVLCEEQNARNKAVMDSQAFIKENLDNHDSRIKSLETKAHGVSK